MIFLKSILVLLAFHSKPYDFSIPDNSIKVFLIKILLFNDYLLINYFSVDNFNNSNNQNDASTGTSKVKGN